jgi:phosphatidylglycerol:prolipoprotein diacylglycerol transferase
MSPCLAYWVNDLDPVIMQIWGPVALRWYGLAYVAAFAIAYFLWRLAAAKGRTPLSRENIEELMTWGIVAVLIGGRLGFMLLYDFGTLVADPLSLFRVYDGGMSFHGAAFGGIVAVLCMAWRRRMDAFAVGDLAVMGVPTGLLLGRLANFVNGELWGRVTTADWAVVFPKAPLDASAPIIVASSEKLAPFLANPRHPSQLYEAVAEGLILGAIILPVFWRSELSRKIPGMIAGLFLVLYAVARMSCEAFREPDVGVSPILGFSRGVAYSFILFDMGLTVMVFAIIRARRRGAVASQGGDTVAS